MQNTNEKPIGYKFAKNVLPPETPEEEILRAAENVANVIEVIYRICDWRVREKKEGEIRENKR